MYDRMLADLYKPDARLTVWVAISVDNPGKQCKYKYDEKRDKDDACYVGVTRPSH